MMLFQEELEVAEVSFLSGFSGFSQMMSNWPTCNKVVVQSKCHNKLPLLLVKEVKLEKARKQCR